MIMSIVSTGYCECDLRIRIQITKKKEEHESTVSLTPSHSQSQKYTRVLDITYQIHFHWNLSALRFLKITTQFFHSVG